MEWVGVGGGLGKITMSVAFTDPWATGARIDVMAREIIISRYERKISNIEDTSSLSELPSGTVIQSKVLWSDLQKAIDLLCISYFDHDATFTEGGTIPWYTQSSFYTKAGLNASGWRRATTWSGSGSPSYSYGYAQTGDILGPWIFEDLQDAMSVMRMIPLGERYGNTNVFLEMSKFNAILNADTSKWITDYGYSLLSYDSSIDIDYDYLIPPEDGGDGSTHYTWYFGVAPVESGSDLDMVDMLGKRASGEVDYSSVGISAARGIAMIVDSATHVAPEAESVDVSIGISVGTSLIIQGLYSKYTSGSTYTDGLNITESTADYTATLDRTNEGVSGAEMWATVEPDFSYCNT